ncbi:hypothetical protein NLI96_g2689 [Meripilus lineatus]|uniref:DUF6535 domain-containing protein n=1 Tax=Meripilus lineatus TaxID=2056292 RepID=A0AAD5V8D1_9APHY|nr:hypothetical protein NLI96_g2689 [Physisporinus lineatus]
MNPTREPVIETVALTPVPTDGEVERPPEAAAEPNTRPPDVSGGLPQDARGASSGVWVKCLESVEKRNKELTESWKDEIDSLLVFAGLFSALLVAFIIESYKFLQQDPAEATVVLLMRISAQMGNGTNVMDIPPITPFKRPASSVWINALWFSSLILSLTSAAGAIHAKDWIHTFSKSVSALPQDAARVRQFRYQAFREWFVPDIISVLPTLLEVALLLFVIGIVYLLWTIDIVVAAIVSALALLTMLPLVFLPILPFFFETCPFVSPVTRVASEPLLRIILLPGDISRKTTQVFKWLSGIFTGNGQPSAGPLKPSSRQQSLSNISFPSETATVFDKVFKNTSRFVKRIVRSVVVWKDHQSWEKREKAVVNVNRDFLDAKILASVDAIQMDNTFLASVRSALSEAPYPVAREALILILTQRSTTVVNGALKWSPIQESEILLAQMVVDIAKRAREEKKEDEELLNIMKVLGEFCDAISKQCGSEGLAVLCSNILDCLLSALPTLNANTPSKEVVSGRLFQSLKTWTHIEYSTTSTSVPVLLTHCVLKPLL